VARLSKEELRRRALALVRSLGPEELRSLSERVKRNLLTVKEFQNSKVIACYVAKSDEVQTESILRAALKQKVRVLVPLTDTKNRRLIFSELHDFSELAQGTFGILEPKPEFLRPAPLEEADVVLVPLVAWDERGFRIGHGKGYFDGALAPLKRPAMIGLAFEIQRVDMVPERPYDISLQIIVTESRVLRTRAKPRTTSP
jgi:5-formyltetrahydrofolate cyclo-ligase